MVRGPDTAIIRWEMGSGFVDPALWWEAPHISVWPHEWVALAPLRYRPGGCPYSRLNARLKAASDS